MESFKLHPAYKQFYVRATQYYMLWGFTVVSVGLSILFVSVLTTHLLDFVLVVLLGFFTLGWGVILLLQASRSIEQLRVRKVAARVSLKDGVISGVNPWGASFKLPTSQIAEVFFKQNRLCPHVIIIPKSHASQGFRWVVKPYTPYTMSYRFPLELQGWRDFKIYLLDHHEGVITHREFSEDSFWKSSH